MKDREAWCVAIHGGHRVGHNLVTEQQQIFIMGFPDGSVVKNPPANAGDTGDALEEEKVTRFSILAWKIPPPEEHGGLQFMGLQRVRND